MMPWVFDVKVDVKDRSATGRVADGSPRGKRIKVWFSRNIAGDWYVARVRLGLFRGTQAVHGPVLHVICSELLRDFAVARHNQRG
jgi:hypothetical protein